MANLDNFEVGQTVIARFTNSHSVYQFTGRIVGKTKNYWKVETITSPYENGQPGRVFRITSLLGRGYSPNNCIVKVVDEKPRLLRVKSSHVFPPIPIRNFDYSAYIDGREEDEHGWG